MHPSLHHNHHVDDLGSSGVSCIEALGRWDAPPGTSRRRRENTTTELGFSNATKHACCVTCESDNRSNICTKYIISVCTNWVTCVVILIRFALDEASQMAMITSERWRPTRPNAKNTCDRFAGSFCLCMCTRTSDLARIVAVFCLPVLKPVHASFIKGARRSRGVVIGSEGLL